MAECGGYGVAAWAFDVQEVGVGGLHQPLQLVLSLLFFWSWMEQIDFHIF
jgi:hypothetical protein